MVCGVALGVAVVISVDLANEAARRGFARSAEQIGGRATHCLTGGPGRVPETTLAWLRSQHGLRLSAPVVEGTAIALDAGREPLRVLGIDPLSEAPFRATLGAPSASSAYSRLIAEPGAVISAAFAVRHDLELGATLRLLVDDHIESLPIVGVIGNPSTGDGTPDDLLIMDVGQAQALFALQGQVTRIDLILTEEAAAALEKHLPDGLRLGPAGERAATLLQLTRAFHLNLTALSLLALLVGMFLIHNTVMFSVVRRRRVLGTLRALGATSEQVFGMVLTEAAAAASLGSVLGLGLGWLLGQGVVALVTRTINDLYYVVSITGAPLTWASACKGVLLGIGAGILSAIGPAREAASVPPTVAMRPTTLEESTRRSLPRVALLGLVLSLAGATLLITVPRSVTASFAALFLVVLGAALAVPFATVGAMRVATPVSVFFAGPLGRLATRTLTRTVGRTGVAIASLMVAISVTISVSVMIQSFRGTVANWLAVSLRADLYVSAPFSGPRREKTLSPDVAALVKAVPGVVEIETYRATRVWSDVGEVSLGVSDTTHARSLELYRFADGGPAQAWEQVRRGAVIVSESFAYHHSLPNEGASLMLSTDAGPQTFPIVGVFYDYTTEEGTVLMTRNVYEHHWRDRGLTSIAAYTAPDTDAGQVAGRVRTALAGHALSVTQSGALRDSALRVFDRTFAVTHALRVLAVVVAFIGVWSALMALQLERTHEMATFSAIGMTPGQIRWLTGLETGWIGLTAGVFAVPIGVLLAMILVQVINVRSFGWTMALQLDPGIFAQALAVSVGAALLAGVYPLWRLSTLPVAAALRRE
jgi:putative ABC transport system permease protein